MYAIIHMQPLNHRREPLDGSKPKRVAILPRDAEPHWICGAFELNKYKEMPYYIRIWADGKFGGDYEALLDPPRDSLRFLSSIACTMLLTVNPRRN